MIYNAKRIAHKTYTIFSQHSLLRFLAVFFVYLFVIGFSLNALDFYWENPVALTNSDSRFPSAASNSLSSTVPLSVVTWQEVIQSGNQKGSIYLSANISDLSGASPSWNSALRFAGPFQYSGEIPDIHSVAVNSKGVIAVAVLSNTQTISVYTSDDLGKTFSQYQFPSSSSSLVAPRVYSTSSDSFIIFATQGKDEAFSLLYSKSYDGLSWTEFLPFAPAASQTNAFVPMLCAFPTENNNAMNQQGYANRNSRSSSGKTTDMVVFQASYNSGTRLSYQIYSTVSMDGGETWSSSSIVTDKEFSSSLHASQVFTNYHNQRPNVYIYNGTPYLAWERTYYSSENAQIYVVRLSNDGKTVGVADEITTSGDGKQPVLFESHGILSLLWFDSRRGVYTVYMAQRNGVMWEEERVSKTGKASSFSIPVLVPSLALKNTSTANSSSPNTFNSSIQDNNSDLYIFWQQEKSDGTGQIIRLSPDKTTMAASFHPLSYTENKRSASSKVSIRVSLPEDSSGIAGYSWIWTQNNADEPPEQFMNLATQTDLSMQADKDGTWYLKVRVCDYAGNWSDTSSAIYYRDTTPPAAPIIAAFEQDEYGFGLSNTVQFSWKPGFSQSEGLPFDAENDSASIDDDIAGYTWALEYLSPVSSEFSDTKKHPMKASAEKAANEVASLLSKKIQPAKPPARIRGAQQSTSYSNRENGLYAFSVSAIDTVGNISKPSIVYTVLNKYIPYTAISSIDSKSDDFGNISLSIYGKGFTYDGTIASVYIDDDGNEPYNMVLTSDLQNFKVNSDGRISGITISDLEEGNYKIGLLHTDRGLYFTGKILNVPETGTVKKGNYTFKWSPNWKPITETFVRSVQMGDILLWMIFVFALAGLVVAIRGIAYTAKDSIIVQHEMRSLITGDVMPLTKKKKAAQLKIRGVGLRFKLVFFTTFLIIMVILLVSIPLGIQMVRSQEQTLTRGLKERVDVLLEGLSAGVKAYLPAQNILELGFLPQQTEAMDEVKYATITGLPAAGDNTGLDFIWATNDTEISEKIDTETLSYGTSRLGGEQTAEINKICTELNEKAVSSAGEMAENITKLTAEGISLASRTDSVSVERRGEIQVITRELNEKLTSALNALSSSGAGSWPKYSEDSLDRSGTTYIFYKPVLYRQGADQNYVRAVIQVEVSTENLIVSVDEARDSIIKTTGFIALLAVGIGAFMSLILAAVIIRPIRHLASHVAMIRDTEDKEELEGKDIKIRSHDEIGLLGETVNDMTHGLVKAAAASKDLTVGKEVQKMFIPLETDSSGKKLTTGMLEDNSAQFFGYYEGAKGVSGDYFDYKKLDDRWYAIIKCDVSGKGVPAALIMVEVATLFLNYFKDWSFKKNGTNLSPIVSQINDLIESRGFKGRFAAFTLCLFDSVSGMVYFCNAGDNLIHYYDATEHKKKTVTLPEAAAAGVFPSFMVDMKGGFKVSSMKLKKGDVLFLYTDGIEEAKRMFRDENYKPIVCAEPGLPPEAPHGYHTVGQESEEMAPERVNAIIEAVFSKSVYRLEKYHNPIKNEILEFDFTTCSGTAEDAIIALVSVEKIFRMYRDPSATEFDRVQVDKKIDGFLNLHFRQYADYCLNKKENAAAPEYLFYTNIKEDGQYDDLTLIAVKKL